MGIKIIETMWAPLETVTEAETGRMDSLAPALSLAQPLAQGGAILLAAVRVWNRGVDLLAPAQGVHTLKLRQAAEQSGQPAQCPWGRRPPFLSS